MTIYGGYSEQPQYHQDYNYQNDNGGLDEEELKTAFESAGYENYEAELLSKHMRNVFGDKPITAEDVSQFGADSDRIGDAAREEAHECFKGNRTGRMSLEDLQSKGLSAENASLVAQEYGDGASVNEQELANAIETGDVRPDGKGGFGTESETEETEQTEYPGEDAANERKQYQRPNEANGYNPKGDHRDSKGNFECEGGAPENYSGSYETEEPFSEELYFEEQEQQASKPKTPAGSEKESVTPEEKPVTNGETVVPPVNAQTTEEQPVTTEEETITTEGVTKSEATAPVNDGSYPEGATKIELTNDKDYDITLVATPNAGHATIANITIPAGETVTIDVAELTGSANWAGNFEIRASDTMEPTGALLEYNFNANWGQGENVNFFDLSYINGVAYNSEKKDIINTVAYLPNGIVQGNENGDLNEYIAAHWDELYDPSTGLMKPLQNGAALTNKSGEGYNLIAELLLDYREDTDSAFYLYVGTEVSNFADDEFSQGWSGDTGMKVTFY